MEKGELKEKVAGGVAWSMAEKCGTALVQFGVRVVLLRMLLPEDLGVMAILMAFSTIALVVVDSGFSQMLIRREESPSGSDYRSVFRFNIVVSLALYALLVAVSPLIGRFYDMPGFTRLAAVFYLLLPANALCIIQNVIFTRQFRFALLSKVTFAASAASGAIVVAMVLSGCGIWSLVMQQVLVYLLRAAMLWRLSGWRPKARFDAAALRQMAPYSFSLMATDFISALYNKLPQLFLGGIYTKPTLGYFDQAQKLKDLPVSSTMQSVQAVTFPALSRIRHDRAKFAESYRQVAMVVAFALYPVVLGMSAVAPDMFALLLGEKWMPTVPYFEAICLTGLFYPVAMVAYNVLKVQSDGRIIVRLEILKKVLLTLIFCITIPRSVQAVVWGLVLFALMELVINFEASRRFSDLGWGRLLRTLAPIGAAAAAMYGAARGVAWLLTAQPLALRLAAEILAGAAVYTGLAALLRFEALRETLRLVRRRG